MDIRKFNIDLEQITSKLDITPSMYNSATDKYNAVSNYLLSMGINADIYPQGSFSMGTVVRPYDNGAERDYDLDFMCNLDNDKSSITPKQVKCLIGDALIENKIYKERLLPEDNKCWTLEYSKQVDDIGFKMDIVPSIKESQNLIVKNCNNSYATQIVSITNKDNDKYYWQQSNPKGLIEWFNDINKPFNDYNRIEKRRKLFESNRQMFNSIEDVPEQLERSSLQRVIQLLKRHRDIYYTAARAWDNRPSSIIITTLVANIAQNANNYFDTYNLLIYVVDELNKYSDLQFLNQEEFELRHNNTHIKKSSSKWQILSPVYPFDNYAESWDSKTAELFFKWLKNLVKDFKDVENLTEEYYYGRLETAFGKEIISKVKPKDNILPEVKISNIKPWSDYEL